MDKIDAPRWALLHRLAAALGIPVERFLSDAPPMEATAQADACLRLWSEIRTEEGRRQALEALRAILERERG